MSYENIKNRHDLWRLIAIITELNNLEREVEETEEDCSDLIELHDQIND